MKKKEPTQLLGECIALLPHPIRGETHQQQKNTIPQYRVHAYGTVPRHKRCIEGCVGLDLGEASSKWLKKCLTLMKALTFNSKIHR